jgi:hypothetical protein
MSGSRMWSELDQLATEHGLPDRAIDAMFDAVLGYRVRRGGYAKRTQVDGSGRGRYYAAGKPLLAIQQRRREAREPLRDPYPWMRAKLAEPTDAPSW